MNSQPQFPVALRPLKQPCFRGFAVFVGWMLSSTFANAQFIYSESFTNSTAAGWTFQDRGTSPGPRLTAGATPDVNDPETGTQLDTEGNGWLRLATNTGNQDNAVTLNTDIPSSANNITIGFDFTIWDQGGIGAADGISVFLYDADVPFNAGADGGSLSYAQKTGVDGLHGAYLGVGLDVWGNFSNATEGRTGSDPALTSGGGSVNQGFLPNQVVLRGPDDSVAQDGTGNYYYLAGTGGNDYTSAGDDAIASLNATTQNLNFSGQDFRPDQDADQFRRFLLELDENDLATISIEFGQGTGLVELFTADLSGFARPENLRIGFGAATGGAQEVHEIRNLVITADGLGNSWYWQDTVDDDLWTTAGNWDPSSSVPADHSDVIFSDAFATTDTDDTITVSGGDKTIASVFFTGQYSYTLDPAGGQSFILDTDGSGESEITVTNNPNGNADHTINLDLDLNNNLNVNNLVMQALNLGGDISGDGNDIVFQTTGTTTASGVISGTGTDITVNGTGGTTVLSGNNTYTGTTTVETGILQIENSNALGASSGDTVVENGATLALAGNISIPGAEFLDIAGSGVGGIGALSNTSGNNTFSGDIDLTADATIGAQAGTLNLDSNDSLDTAGFDLTFNTASGATVDVDRIIDDGAGTSDVIIDGAGTVIFSADNTYDGATIINGGILQIENADGLGDPGLDTTVNDGGTLALAGGITTNVFEDLFLSGQGVAGRAGLWNESDNNTFSDTITLQNGGGSVGANAGTTLTLGSVISGANQDLTISGDGTVVLSATNTYTGTTNITDGTLRNDANGQISDASAVAISAGATYDLNGFTETVASLAGAGDVDLSSNATLTAGGDNTDTIWSGDISGNGDFNKAGTGTLTVSGTNAFTGTVEINDGSVLLESGGAFATSADIILDGGTLANGNFTNTFDNLTVQSDSAINFDGQSASYLTFDDITRSGGTLTIDNWNGNLAGNGNTRLQVTAATLAGFGDTSGLTNVSITGWGDGELIDLGGGLFEIVPTLDDFFIWDGSNNNRWTNRNNWQLADGSTPSGDPDANGAKAYFGDLDTGLNGSTIQLRTDISLGVLVIDNDDTFTLSSNNNNHEFFFNNNGSQAAISVLGTSVPTISRELRLQDDLLIANNSTGTLTITDSVNAGHDVRTGGNTVTFDGSGLTVVESQITEAGSVVKNGTGTLELTDNNTFTGGFTLNSGTVLVGNNGALGSTVLQLNGGTLSATGGDRVLNETYNINGDLTIGNDDGSDLTFSSLNGNIAAGDQVVTVESGVTFNISGDLGGTGGLVKEGEGILDLGGNDSNFSGGLTVNAGTVQTTANDNLVIGSVVGADNYLGSGDITVNTGGTLTATNTGNFDIDINAGGTLTNTGGTVTLQNTNAGSDLEIFGNIAVSGGTTTLAVGDNVDLEAGSDITATGGILNINGGDDFVTLGTAGNTADITASNGSTVNVDLSGGNTGVFTLGEFDSIALDGDATEMNITGDAATNINLNGIVTLNNGSTLTVLAGETNLSNTIILDGGTGTEKGTLEVRGDLNLDTPRLANDPNITINVSGASEIASSSGTTSIENIGTLTKSGTGTTTINANVNNIQADRINISEGTLLNGADNQIENSTPLELSGGTWDTGGFDEVLGTLTLTDTSVIDLNSGDSIIEFADSTGNDADWNASEFIFIDNWSGNLAGGGTDQLIFDSAGLTTNQLARIVFRNPDGLTSGVYGAQFIGNELVPIFPVPEPSTYVLGALAIGLLVGFEYRRRKKLSDSSE